MKHLSMKHLSMKHLGLKHLSSRKHPVAKDDGDDQHHHHHKLSHSHSRSHSPAPPPPPPRRKPRRVSISELPKLRRAGTLEIELQHAGQRVRAALRRFWRGRGGAAVRWTLVAAVVLPLLPALVYLVLITLPDAVEEGWYAGLDPQAWEDEQYARRYGPSRGYADARFPACNR
ncbi:hypothetical protein F4780DRAFT_782547 [Xylariomycetidae sp. FL0641]|nr:hypothetical protein F4780DRAFT_782547 [Xylariomycetidae sp. FL0641]